MSGIGKRIYGEFILPTVPCEKEKVLPERGSTPDLTEMMEMIHEDE